MLYIINGDCCCDHHQNLRSNDCLHYNCSMSDCCPMNLNGLSQQTNCAMENSLNCLSAMNAILTTKMMTNANCFHTTKMIAPPMKNAKSVECSSMMHYLTICTMMTNLLPCFVSWMLRLMRFSLLHFCSTTSVMCISMSYPMLRLLDLYSLVVYNYLPNYLHIDSM